MNRWDTLTMSEKNQLLGIYASKGYNNLANIIAHYNSFAEGGNVDGKGDDIDNRTGKPRYRREIHDVNITSSSDSNIEGAARDTSTIGPLAFYPPKYYIGKQGNQFEENPNVTYDSWFDEHPEMIDVMTDIVGRYNNRLNNRGQQLPQLNRFYFEKLYNPEDDPIIHEAIERMLQAKWNRDVRTYNDNRTLNLWDTVEKFPAANTNYAKGGHLYQGYSEPTQQMTTKSGIPLTYFPLEQSRKQSSALYSNNQQAFKKEYDRLQAEEEERRMQARQQADQKLRDDLSGKNGFWTAVATGLQRAGDPLTSGSPSIIADDAQRLEDVGLTDGANRLRALSTAIGLTGLSAYTLPTAFGAATNVALKGSRTALGAAGRMMLPSTWTTAAGLSSGIGTASDAAMFTDMVYHGGKNLLNANNWSNEGRYGIYGFRTPKNYLNLGMDLASVIPVFRGVKGGIGLASDAANFARNWRLKVPESYDRYYRYVGDDAIADYIRSGVIRASGANPDFQRATIMIGDRPIQLGKTFDYSMFSKGKPWEGSLSSSALTAGKKAKQLNILRSKADTGPTVWEESNVDFRHKGHAGIFRPNYFGDLNATPTDYFEWWEPKRLGYLRHEFPAANMRVNNEYQRGGKLTLQHWKSQMQSKYPDLEMDNNKAGYDYDTYFKENYDDAIKMLNDWGSGAHFTDRYKLPNHPTFSDESMYSRGPNMGGSWSYDLLHTGEDIVPREKFNPSVINKQQHPELYTNGGSLGHITPYGQWQYPHQVTTIPSNNITMQGVDYPVVGISNTGDVKYMLPNMDYLFNGQYVTEYPIK